MSIIVIAVLNTEIIAVKMHLAAITPFIYKLVNKTVWMLAESTEQ